MKSICLSFISLFLLSLSSYGQNGKTVDLKDVSIHAGDSVTVKAEVINVVDGPLHNTYLLAVGNDFPKPAIKVWIVEIYDFPYYPTVLVNKGEISFTGKLENIKGQMWMMIYHSNQIKLTSKQRSAIISLSKKQSKAERKEIREPRRACNAPASPGRRYRNTP